ncbi:efflux RND transporter periplasmic adaptor subunit [Acidovorax sp. SUPP2539]|uniref:efflux RND transporter periplasmic adaptor subunit n=1 Tax=Acidovorax sp. SUPP2539 TaxID=2920878 RepID=UPI0023DE33B5|nr:efflux RND transporter periplasmic adaptor subunit [Acidovorax sp. SUPP2539]GKS91516.1 efflux RND transporter periplasmic adaptor subunit [Acidovorax sp. SUPP2539]
MTMRGWGALGMGCALAAGLVACKPAEKRAAAEPVQVTVLALKPEAVTVREALAGRVAAVRSAEIRAQVGGIVQRRLFEQGADIAAGQPLFQINPAPFQADADMAAAALQRTQAAWRRAQAQTARLEPLMREGAVSRQDYDDAASQRDQAAAEVAQAEAVLARRRLDLRFARIDAPIAGRIDQALVTEGALVGAGDATPMARIQQIDKVYVDVRQPASALEALRAGGARLPVRILRADGQPYALHGRILFSALQVDPGTGDVLLRIQVDNPERQLLPGMFVRAEVVKSQYADALLVPQQAVQRVEGRAQVWRVQEGHVAQPAEVQLGEAIGPDYRVRSGLEPGQRVVVEGIERLTAGAQVAPKPWQPSASASALRAGAH